MREQLRFVSTPTIEQTETPQATLPLPEPQITPEKTLSTPEPENSLIPKPANHLEDETKLKMLNGIIKTMDFKQELVIIPEIDMINMIRIMRASQRKITDLLSYGLDSNRVNQQIDNIKEYTKRGFLD